MKYIVLLLLLCSLTVCCKGLSAQAFNTVLRDNLDYTPRLNDVWGYVDPDDGTEYALVGLSTGLSIVSLADPDNIAEVAFIPGVSSTWRDIKAFGEYAYVVADSGAEGILSVDLSGLPGSVTHQFFTTDLTRAHNIYIDVPTGLAYVAGSNVNSGGMVIFDLATTPGTPVFEAFGPAVYAHDVYVQNGVMYASEIYVGNITLYDVTDPQNISPVGIPQTTPFAFTHNAWASADGNYVFTTDERGDASTAAYDVSDPMDITLVDEFRPARSLNTGTVPHNAHFLDDYLIISHYTDGVEIVDASVPENMVEVGYYDSWSGADGGFSGSWGAYPFLPSGLVLSSDIQNGLFVFEVDYQRAARLRGRVTEMATGNVLNNVAVSVASPDGAVAGTDGLGDYIVGSAAAGPFEVTYSKAGYFPETVTVNFQSGTIETANVVLRQKNLTSISGTVLSSATSLGVMGATVEVSGPDGFFTTTTDASGNITINDIFEGDYTLFAGKWGFEDMAASVTVQAGQPLNIQLTPGYQDGFAVDQGWTVVNNAATGAWERGVPNGTTFEGSFSNPNVDAAAVTDAGASAYVTGNAVGGTAGTDDVDGGTTTLLSPVFDPAFFGADDVMISFQYWFFNDGGNTLQDDTLKIFLTNGTDTEVLRAFYFNDLDNNTPAGTWVPTSLLLSELTIPITATMQFGALIGDTGLAHLVEGGIDNFSMEGVVALPVEFLSFSARPLDKASVELAWTTATETDSDYYAVERSTNGRDFSIIGRVNAAGTSLQTSTYRFTDREAVVGDNIYRLRQVDLNGRVHFSEIRQVRFTGGAAPILAWPNPAVEQLNLSGELTGFARIFRVDGTLVRQQKLQQATSLRVAGLPAGYYLLRVGDQVVPFVKR